MKAVQKSSSTNWESERAQLIAERDQLMQLLAESEEAAAIALERQISTAVERVRKDLTAENEKLRKELHESTKSAKDWTTERARLMAESERTTQLLSGSDEAAAIALERQIATAVERARADLNLKLATQKKEHERVLSEIEGNRSGKFHKEMTAVVASVRAELGAEAEKLHKEIDRLKGERDQAQMQLADLRNEHSHCPSDKEAKARLQAELESVREQLSHAEQLVEEYEQQAAEREQTNKLLSEAVEKQRSSLLENEQIAAETMEREIAAAVQKVRDELKGEEDRMREEWDSELSRLADENSNTLEDRKRLQEELERVKSTAAQGGQERDRLQEELERVKSTAAQREQERDRLQEDLDQAMQALNEAKSSEGHESGNIDLDVVREEVARVETSLQTIIKAIEDPSAELSFVVRKNVERAQLDSYLQGLRFATGTK